MTAALAPVLDPGPPPPFDGMRVSEADYWAFYYEGPEETYEWNNGVLEEKGVSDHLTFRVYDWFLQLLIEYLRAHPIAERVGLETGFRLTLPSGVAIRRPDYGLILHTNPRPIAGTDNSYKGIYDVCIEGLSTSSREQRDRDLIVKKAEYAAAGVREYYILHHRPDLRAFYRLGPRGLYEPIPAGDEGVIASGVLPGLRWRLADLDRQPPMETLTDDPLYRGFVALSLQRAARAASAAQALALSERERAAAAEAREQAERDRAAEAEALVQAERDRAAEAEALVQAERDRAAEAEARAAAAAAHATRLAEKLRALGIEPD